MSSFFKAFEERRGASFGVNVFIDLLRWERLRVFSGEIWLRNSEVIAAIFGSKIVGKIRLYFSKIYPYSLSSVLKSFFFIFVVLKVCSSNCF